MESATTKIHDLLQRHLFDDAVLVAEDSYKRNPTSTQTLVEYVSLLLRLGHLKVAESILASRRYSTKDGLSVYYLYEEVYGRTGNLEKLNELRAALNSSELEALSALQATRKPEAGFANEHVLIKDEFLRLLRRLINSEVITEPQAKKAFTLLKAGHVLEGKIVLKELAHSMKGERSPKLLLLAEIALLNGRYDTAKIRYKRLLESFDDKSWTYNRLGDIELIEGNKDHALEMYQKALSYNQEDSSSYLDIIRTHILKGDHRAAKKAYNIASEHLDESELQQFKLNIENLPTPSSTSDICGLCWTEMGGDVLPIEILVKPGSGNLILTGNMGLDMRESAQTAHSYCTSRGVLKRNGTLLSDIHVNVSKASIHKDGPSAGLAFAIGMLAKCTGDTVSDKSAFTGELTLNGDVLPVGGIRSKVVAAYINGIAQVFIPRMNFYELGSLPGRVKSAVSIHLASNIRQVEAILWPR